MLFILNVMHPCVETDSHKNCRKNTNMHALVKKIAGVSCAGPYSVKRAARLEKINKTVPQTGINCSIHKYTCIAHTSGCSTHTRAPYYDSTIEYYKRRFIFRPTLQPISRFRRKTDFSTAA